MFEALLWGGVAASSLVLGAALAMLRRWHDPFVGSVLGFGAGALIASISFELAEEGLKVGGATALALGLAGGALSFYVANRLVTQTGVRDGGDAAGSSLALGALLDGVPEQVVLGIGLASAGSVSPALLVAVFVSNLPESVGSSADMLGAGKSRRTVLTLWLTVAAVCTAATVLGYLVADVVGSQTQAGINGFAAGALLVMLIDSMVPEAKEKAQDVAGLATVLGFSIAAGLSLLG